MTRAPRGPARCCWRSARPPLRMGWRFAGEMDRHADCHNGERLTACTEASPTPPGASTGRAEGVEDRCIMQVGPDPLDREADQVKHLLEDVCGFQTAAVTLLCGHAAVDGDVELGRGVVGPVVAAQVDAVAHGAALVVPRFAPDLHAGRAGREHAARPYVLGLGGLEQPPGLLLGEDQGRPHAVDLDRWCAGGLQHGSAPGSAGGFLLYRMAWIPG